MAAGEGAMRVRVSLAALAFVGVTLGAGLVVAADAGDTAAPTPVSIDLFPTQFCCPELGSWTASGAISDSGSYVRTVLHDTGSIPDPFNPEHTGAFQEIFVLTGSQGTLTVKDESIQRVLKDGGVIVGTEVRAVWQIVSGTGAYAHASGHGVGTFVPSTFSFDLTGVASKVD
jgi:hypothetical protein